MALRLSFFFFNVGSDEAAVRSKETARMIKRGCRSLSQLVKSSEAQVVFSSVLLVAGNGIGRNRQTQLINICFQDWCHQIFFIIFLFYFFCVETVAWSTPYLLEPDRVPQGALGKKI